MKENNHSVAVVILYLMPVTYCHVLASLHVYVTTADVRAGR